MVNSEAQKVWTRIIANPNMVAVFAGHFHSTNASSYGGPFSSATGGSAHAVYVAPPLAMKNQWAVSQPKRGLLTIDVRNNQVRSVVIDWYVGFDPTSRTAGTQTPRVQLGMDLNLWKWVALYLALALLIVCWDICLIWLERQRSGDR
jgi:hypothetical protein